jgi:hypothetical protein
MVDEIFDRTYQAGRADLHSGIERSLASLGSTLAEGFKRLNRIQWAAPWARSGKDVGCA